MVVVTDGRRYWGTNDLPLPVPKVTAQYSPRPHIAETLRLLTQEWGWVSGSCQEHQAQWAHVP